MNKEKTKEETVTPQSKSISRFNALKHGLLSKEVLIYGEDVQILIDFGTAVKDELKPIGVIEEALVDRIISGYWRLRRAIYVESGTMDWHQHDSDIFPIGQSEDQQMRKYIRNILDNDSIEKILRYETAIERSIFRALHELERAQAKRTGEKVLPPLVVDIHALDGKENSVS